MLKFNLDILPEENVIFSEKNINKCQIFAVK